MQADETSSNPVADAESQKGEGTMADAERAIDAAPTKLEQKLKCICLNKNIDLDNPHVRIVVGVVTAVVLIIFFAPLVAMSGSSDSVERVVVGSGYGGCSTAATRRELAQLTRSATGNTGACVGGGDVATCTGDVIQVFPFALEFAEAEKFCVDMGGHLASVHNQAEMDALKAATQQSGVTNAVLIGAHEPSGQWAYTDSSPIDMNFMNTLRPGRIAKQTPTSPIAYLRNHPTARVGDPMMPYDNYQQNEDEMAYCGPRCCAAPGRETWGMACCSDDPTARAGDSASGRQDIEWVRSPPGTGDVVGYNFLTDTNTDPSRGHTGVGQCRCCEGMHDWGRRDSGLTTEHFACKFGPDSASDVSAASCSTTTMRQELADLAMASSSANTGATASNGDTIQVFPLALRFDDAERFCTDFGGHLASIRNDADFRALDDAVEMSGVGDAVFVGAYEEHIDQHWMWTDGTPMDMTFLTTHAWGFDNYQENNEDEVAYCGLQCNLNHGWGTDGAAGFHDWGRRDDGVTSQQFACRFSSNGVVSQYSCPDSAASEKQCGANYLRRQVSTLTANSQTNVQDGITLSNGDRLQVFPFALKFTQADQFCQDVGGNLASIRDEDDYAKLELATRQAGVTNAVFVGAFNENDPIDPVAGPTAEQHLKDTCNSAQGDWKWVDGTPWNSAMCDFVNSHLMGTMNNGQDEDQMVYCGDACLSVPERSGWVEAGLAAGFYDWGNKEAGTVSEHFACRIPAAALEVMDATPCPDEVLRLELAQLTRSSANNRGVTTGNGDLMLVYPMALVFDEAEQFCVDLGGHLASIHTPGEYLALEAATAMSGVTDAVFIGGYEDECHAGTMGAECSSNAGEQGTSFQVGTATSSEACIAAVSGATARIACARADLSDPDADVSKRSCEAAGQCHYIAGWQWTDGSNMNLPWIETLRPGTIQQCGCHRSEGGWVPDAATPGSPMYPFDNYGQNENEMAYCGPACCAVPSRANWGAECCVEDNMPPGFREGDSGAKWRAPVPPGTTTDQISDADLPFAGMTNSHGEVVWRRCTQACYDDDVEMPGHCRFDALNPNIGWGTCASDACAKLPGCEEDVPCNPGRPGFPVGCTNSPNPAKCNGTAAPVTQLVSLGPVNSRVSHCWQ